jgi:hypothetical protein
MGERASIGRLCNAPSPHAPNTRVTNPPRRAPAIATEPEQLASAIVNATGIVIVLGIVDGRLALPIGMVIAVDLRLALAIGIVIVDGRLALPIGMVIAVDLRMALAIGIGIATVGVAVRR